uniref:Homeobox domain-containing protein n=1 Tax=Sander lucioperca TaxID=283035 RepID=A0A8C9X9R7_SANLU
MNIECCYVRAAKASNSFPGLSDQRPRPGGQSFFTAQVGGDGKTRTKDKYRVVYTDHQRLELEKEFHYSKYITIRRKAELATTLGLSERQVKIWFQNRRAKERKINKKKLQQPASSTTTPPISGGGGGNSVAMVTSSSGNNNNNNNNNNGLVSPSSLPLNIKEEY